MQAGPPGRQQGPLLAPNGSPACMVPGSYARLAASTLAALTSLATPPTTHFCAEPHQPHTYPTGCLACQAVPTFCTLPCLADRACACSVRSALQRLYSKDPTLQPVDESGQRLLSEPAGGIGLQACRLAVWGGGCMGGEDGESIEFEAGVPWWRAGD